MRTTLIVSRIEVRAGEHVTLHGSLSFSFSAWRKEEDVFAFCQWNDEAAHSDA